MRKNIVFLFILSILIASCSNSAKYTIKKGQVGHVNQKTVIFDLKEIFKNLTTTIGKLKKSKETQRTLEKPKES